MATDFTLLLKMKIILLKILTVVVFLICTKMLQNYLNKIKLAKWKTKNLKHCFKKYFPTIMFDIKVIILKNEIKKWQCTTLI